MRYAPEPAAPDAAPDVAGKQSAEASVSNEPRGGAGSAAPGSALASHPDTATIAPRAHALLLTLRAHDTEDVLAALNLHCLDPSVLPGDMPRASSPAPDPMRGIDPSYTVRVALATASFVDIHAALRVFSQEEKFS